jgi:putative transposase
MKRNLVSYTYQVDIPCKYCGDTENVVRFGSYNGIQRYYCKKCKRKFTDNKTLYGMRTPIHIVSSALNMFYEGMSLNTIRRQLNQDYNYFPSDSTVYEWIVRFTQTVLSMVKDYRAKTGSTWIADETVLKIAGRNTWFWDVIDAKTRFLLASHLSLSRTTKDCQTVMIEAIEHSLYIPNRIITDKLRAYSDGIELVFGVYTEHFQSRGFITQPNTNMIERFHGTIKSRTKIMRGMKKMDTARFIMDGWSIHYNFFRPHESLKNKTPGRVAGIYFPFENWEDVVRKS